MAKPSRILDEEHGKRDDDHKLRIKPNRKMAWYSTQGPIRRLRRKRITIGILLLLCIYLFIKFLPEGVQRPSMRPVYTYPSDTNEQKGRPPPRMGDTTEVVGEKANKPTKSTAKDKKPVEFTTSLEPYGKKPSATKPVKGEFNIAIGGWAKYWYDGQIRFNALKETLVASQSMGGNKWTNKNVLFAASNLRSAAVLLPMVCEMARQKKNNVHFAFLGRDEISMKELLEINGVDSTCATFVSVHDARPDRAHERTLETMEAAVYAAMAHMRNYIHPQAVIVDTLELENIWFAEKTKVRAREMDFTLIELPQRSDETLRWLTRLDSASLNAYNRVSINILIHAQPSGSGSILRLLHSLAKADYFGSTPPHISIELPHHIDEDLANQLQSFKWPPKSSHASDSRLTMQKWIPSKTVSADESAVRFLEDFYPIDARNNHVLVLSPQVELSPLYYHYLKYTVLDYKYSRVATQKEGKLRESLMGISLSLPGTYFNDSTVFEPPKHKSGVLGVDGDSLGPSFLWTEPNSEAALYFGEKWAELHRFVSLSLSAPAEKNAAKRVSTTYPSWLEYILSFSLARGSAMIYPQLASGTSLATVHNELYTPPEEFSTLEHDQEGDDGGDEFTADPHISHKHDEAPIAYGSLLDVLDGGATLPIGKMPILSFDGRAITQAQLLDEAEQFSEEFRSSVGGCAKQSIAGAGLVDAPVDYLFCTKVEKMIKVPPQQKKEPSMSVEASETKINFDMSAPTKIPAVTIAKNPAKALAEQERAEKAATTTAASVQSTVRPAMKSDIEKLAKGIVTGTGQEGRIDQVRTPIAEAAKKEFEQSGVVPGTGKDGVIADTRYATTAEGAYHEVTQIKKAKEAADAIEQESPVETPKGTRFEDAGNLSEDVNAIMEAKADKGEIVKEATIHLTNAKVREDPGLVSEPAAAQVTNEKAREESGQVTKPRIENGQVVDEKEREWLRDRWQVKHDV